MCSKNLDVFPDKETKEAYINRIKAHTPIDAFTDLAMMNKVIKPLTINDILEAKHNIEKNHCEEPVYSSVVIKEGDYKKLLNRIDNIEVTILPTTLYGMPVYTYKTEQQHCEINKKLMKLGKSIIDVELT